MSGNLYTTATLDIDDAIQGIDAMERRGHALGAAFRALKKPLALDQRDHRKKREGPSGMWAPQAASTRARRLSSPKHRSKRLLGRLPAAVKYAATSTLVSGTSRVLWSGVQADGGRVGHGARLTARPFLWISDDMLGVAQSVLGTELIRAYGGK